MNNTCIFTIVAPNYLGQAITLNNSIASYLDNVDFKIIIVSDDDIEIDDDIKKNIIYSKDIGIIDYEKICFSYNILEHCTNIKPSCFRYLLDDYKYIYYIDPDIFFYQNPLTLNDFFSDQDILLTPHSLTPILDDFKPTELEFLRTGTFNLGFIGIKRSERVVCFLDWWEERCINYGVNETNSGLFVDQKWMDLAPCFFEFIKIIRNPGLNVGYWNLHERTISINNNILFSNNEKLIFFHFSGLDPYNFDNISRHQTRFKLNSGEVLYTLFEEYSFKLILNSKILYLATIPYSQFLNGIHITELSRKYFWKNHKQYSLITNLFSSSSQLYKDCLDGRLITKSNHKILNFSANSNLKKYSLQIVLLDYILYLIIFVFGPLKFYMFKKYLLQRFSILSDFYKW